MSYIDDTRGVLNDLFTNNINYVAKQVQTIVDFLFPNNEDNSETSINATDIPLMLCGQIECNVGYGYIGYDWMAANCVYNFQFNSANAENMLVPIGQSPATSDRAWQEWGSNASAYFFKGLPENVTRSQFFSNYPEYYGQGIEPITVHFSDGAQPVPYNYGTEGRNVNGTPNIYFNRNYGETSLSTDSTTAYIYFLGADKGKNIIITDIDHSNTFYNNNVIYNNNDYHTYNTYNFNGGSGNGGGTIAVGGGAGGLVVGLGGIFNFGDLELAINTTIDDINLNLNNSDNAIPAVFPSYDDLKYVDMGSFYITPVKQLDTLPIAPDVADTVINVSEPLSILSDGFGALLSSFDSLGVTLTLTFTFLSCLVINKLRGD